ncbi:MAG TPA: PIG-L deacetylase family protein [Burkholderiales bacterium]|nr:PIG-L deacetylase family protein [Burkholderiales bacterium]
MQVSDAPLGLAAARSRSFAARYAGRAVLALGAHPDDIELGIGGTVALLARAGVRVVSAIVSVPADYDTRVDEARAAASILGAELRVLMQECRRIEDLKNYQLVGMVDALVRELEPAAVLTHGPTDFHRDHVQVHHATVSAQRLAPFDLYCYVPTMTRPVPVPFEPNAYVDISGTIDAKLAAIAAHKSQFYSRGIAFDFYRDMARLTGRMAGAQYAEGLSVHKLLFA